MKHLLALDLRIGRIPDIDQDRTRSFSGRVGCLVLEGHVVSARIVELPWRSKADGVRPFGHIPPQREVAGMRAAGEHTKEKDDEAKRTGGSSHRSPRGFSLECNTSGKIGVYILGPFVPR